MVSSGYPARHYKNRILNSLPSDEIARLAPHLSLVPLQRNQPLIDDGKAVENAYFLEDGLAFTVVTTEAGDTVEAGIVGRCGMVGIPILLGTQTIPGRTLMKVPGASFRICAQAVRVEFERQGVFRRMLLRYLQAQLVQTSQTAACNRLHEIKERLASWLLLCHDMLGSDHLPITQELISQMLGAPRTTVTLAVGLLQRDGLIESSRGCIATHNREGLEGAACECYNVIKGEYARLKMFISSEV